MILLWGVIGVILSVPGQTTGLSAFIEPLLETLGVVDYWEQANCHWNGQQADCNSG